MESNNFVLPLSSAELILINGGSDAYDAGYSTGEYLGKCAKCFLLIVAIGMLF